MCDPSLQLPLVSSQLYSCPGVDTHAGGAKTGCEDELGPGSAVGNVSGGRMFLGEEGTSTPMERHCVIILQEGDKNPFWCLYNVDIKQGSWTIRKRLRP